MCELICYPSPPPPFIHLVSGLLCSLVVVTLSGWWFVHVQDQQGWVPSTYLKRADGVKEEHSERARPGEGDWLLID